MKFNAAAVLAALAAVASAAPAAQSPTAPAPQNSTTPAPQTPNPGYVHILGSIDDCYESTFVNQGSGASPLVSDCQIITKNIAGGGTWTIGKGPTQLVQFGTCAFNAGSESGWSKIGNSDIIDLINGSIQKFQRDGKVGSKGRMTCQNVGLGVNWVNWGLYHT
ncbi:hypothetical protein FQN49_001901 [Arthroderma sp. PD_2]|nr:hypothetical protein FQN49_001901 [Arthroderma sp. PD_2]